MQGRELGGAAEGGECERELEGLAPVERTEEEARVGEVVQFKEVLRAVGEDFESEGCALVLDAAVWKEGQAWSAIPR